MSSLRELQAGFRAALLAGDETAVAAEVLPDGLGVPARLAVYRHHVFTSLTTALEATFPVVCALVDRRFFGWLAHRYIGAHPPAGPCLTDYGASLPAFIEADPACATLPWLGDVARLEWALGVALHAPDVPRLTPGRLAAVPPSALAELRLRLLPSVTLLASAWPVDAIWRAHQPGAAAAADLTGGGVTLEIRRVDDDAAFRPLPPATFALRAALGAGRTLADAVDAGRAVDPALDAAAEIRALLDEGVVADLDAAGD